MLAELPPTPNPPSPLRASTSKRAGRNLSHKSPAKVVAVGKAGANRKTIRVSRRSSLTSPSKFQAAFETEVLPPLPAPSFTSASSSLLPTSFVLPPPSPSSAFPAPVLLLSASSPLALPSPPAASQASASTEPTTPLNFRLPFPMAKPFMPRMIHAYSPAKPSPLSRILMLGNSPATPAGSDDDPDSDVGNISMPLEALLEEDEGGMALVDALFPEMPLPPVRQPTLAEELGVSESPPESPEASAPAPASGPMVGSLGGRVFSREPERFTAQQKGKGRVLEVAGVRGTKAAREKENGEAGIRRKMVGLPKVSPPLGSTGGVGGVKVKAQGGAAGNAIGKPGSRARVMAKLPAPSAAKTGPRRVLVDSAEAPAIGRGWRG